MSPNKDKKKESFLLLTMEFPPFNGGVGNYYGNLRDHWPDDGMYVLADGNKRSSPDATTFFRHLSQLPFWPRWLPSLYHSYRLLKRKGIDHILAGHILPLGTVARICSRLFGVKYSIFLHGLDLSCALQQKRKRPLAINILKNAHSIICANTYVREILQSVLSEEEMKKATVVNPGIAHTPPTISSKKISEMKRIHGLEGKRIIFSLGRLINRKGFDKSLKSLPYIEKESRETVYVLAGSGPAEEELRGMIRRARLEDKVIMTGEISEEEKWMWLHLCDLFLMPSRDIDGDFEGFGIVFLEANMAGKPVVAGNEGGVKDAVEEGVNGFLVNPRDEKDISRAVVSLLKNKELREKMGRQGKQRARKKFSWERQARLIHEHLTRNTRA